MISEEEHLFKDLSSKLHPLTRLSQVELLSNHATEVSEKIPKAYECRTSILTKEYFFYYFLSVFCIFFLRRFLSQHGNKRYFPMYDVLTGWASA